jgi:hypothetical protein
VIEEVLGMGWLYRRAVCRGILLASSGKNGEASLFARCLKRLEKRGVVVSSK